MSMGQAAGAASGNGSGLNQPPVTSTFDLDDLKPAHEPNKLLVRVLQNPFALYGLLRAVAPVFSIPRTDWVIVTRYDHVKEVLAQDQVFQVPWGEKMKELNGGGAIFILGIDEHEAHSRNQRQLMQAFRLEDVPHVGAIARDEATAIVEAHRGGRLDAVGDLVTRVPTRICRTYYGIPIPPEQETEFAHWAIAMSVYMFADPTGNPAYRRIAHAAGDRMRPLLDAAIADAKGDAGGRDTVVARLVKMQHADPAITDDVIRGHLLGMVTGFVPTNTIAAGHMLEVLVGGGSIMHWNRTKFMAPARDALRLHDDDLLTRCLLETSRFKPINFGPFRVTERDYTISDGGFAGRRPKTIPKGSKLLVSTHSAMFDGRRIRNRYRFDPDRAPSDYMLFGSGIHVCLGLFLAKAQITQTLKPLLAQKNLRRAPGDAGKLQRVGPFPAHLWVEYDR